ncbi:hypothetical protein CCZ01_08110 [Helicobacter monodelphidis]|uniref:hypothetical protein n=1 Tax=Helicobacter sp. 15-1451 TaxID=2004995 RepID=UPI000DCBE47D|nr:hypothetical protein [Helicobacter sp. 15-1451]RAX56894.1 hypothetical protein CCZ01_08110 [Helicobacter sp. 15-1451]
MISVPYTFVAFETNHTRAYLEMCFLNGFKFEKIIVVVHSKYLGQIRDHFLKNETQFREIHQAIFKNIDIQIPFFEKCDFQKYSDCVEVIDVFPFYPEELEKKIQSNTTYFFSYLGICPENYLQKAQWIHIHPGIIPPIRGSHCLFWSLLLRGMPGYSVFYLNDGIDNGKPLHQYEFKELLPDLSSLKGIDNSLVVEGILNYYDTYLRGRMLVAYLQNENKVYTQEQLSNFPYQNRVFHPMHKDLLSSILSKFFKYGG